ncbi:MAG: hypothetical protein MUF35_08610 [Candidatus Nanopelagicales bacterium]|nr:hypothetical protein [Candidatus Nanopelagicales bacterium]
MDDPASLIEALAALAWPILAIVVIVLLLPTLRRVVRDRPFSIKIGSFEMTAQEASEALLKQITDLQDQLAELQQQVAVRAPVELPDGARDRSGPPPPPASWGPEDAPPQPMPVPQPPTGPPAPLPPANDGQRSILWVDDNPGNNAIEISRLTELGFNVTTRRSTKEALEELGPRPNRFQALITDLGRGPLGRTAGLDTVKAARGLGFAGTAVIYTTPAAARDRASDAARVGAAITASPTELVRMVHGTSTR